MAAEVVSSVVVGEVVSRAVSGLLGSKQEDRMEQRECVERLEMAHVKMEAAVETSDRWQITDVPLLRWRKTLKRTARECDDALRSCKQRAVEDEARAEEVRRSGFPRRIAHATTSLISSFVFPTGGGGCQSSSTVRRFERYADGAEEFLKFVHYGGAAAPGQRYGFFDPLIGQLLGGKFARYEALQGGRYRHFAVDTVYSPERGLEAQVSLVYADSEAPMESFFVWLLLRLSSSVDVIGTAVKSLQSMASPSRRHDSAIATDVAIRELLELPTQDIRWSPQLPLFDQKESHNVHTVFVQRFRPDPFCCKDARSRTSTPAPTTTRKKTANSNSNTLTLSELFPEPVIEFAWHRYTSLPDVDHSSSSRSGGGGGGTRCLRLQTYVMPHDSPVDLDPAHESCASELIHGVAPGAGAAAEHVNVGLDGLDEAVVRNAVDFLRCKPETTSYQVLWRSRHGTAQINLEKVSRGSAMVGGGVAAAGRRKKTGSGRPRGYLRETLKQAMRDNLNLVAVRSSVRLRNAMLAWIILDDKFATGLRWWMDHLR